MKSSIILSSVLFLFVFIACQNEQVIPQPAAKAASPLEGNWILVSNSNHGKQAKAKKYPQQIKMFHDGYFSFVMYDSLGKFYNAAAGPYEITGNNYKETFSFSSKTSLNNSYDVQHWEMKGDTLIFYGYDKAVLSTGRDVTYEWGGKNKFIEKCIRVQNLNTQPPIASNSDDE